MVALTLHLVVSLESNDNQELKSRRSNKQFTRGVYTKLPEFVDMVGSKTWRHILICLLESEDDVSPSTKQWVATLQCSSPNPDFRLNKLHTSASNILGLGKRLLQITRKCADKSKSELIVCWKEQSMC